MISKYEFIDGEKANYPVTKMCLWAGVSKSATTTAKRPLSATAERARNWRSMSARSSMHPMAPTGTVGSMPSWPQEIAA